MMEFCGTTPVGLDMWEADEVTKVACGAACWSFEDEGNKKLFPGGWMFSRFVVRDDEVEGMPCDISTRGVEERFDGGRWGKAFCVVGRTTSSGANSRGRSVMLVEVPGG